jgi:hypothetical protein
MRGARSSSFALSIFLGLAVLPACGDDGAGAGGGGGEGATDASASSTSSTSSTGGACDGVIEDGVCVGKCSPDLCLPGNTCVNNRCTLTCDAHDDCYAGTACNEVVEDDTGATILACTASTKSAILGANCFFGNECDATTVCPDGTACGASLCGGQACTDGLCPDGTACTPATCEPDACRPPRCLGAVADGAQSPSGTSYCTQDDCTADADCAPGMYCGTTRDFHPICGSEGEIELEDPSLPCIDPADFTAGGKTYVEGPVSLLRNTCVYRKQCSPCASDLDCSGAPGQLCAELGGEGRCATTCVADADCEKDAACLEDPAHPGTLVCTPRYGSCIGEPGEFCAPCVNDLDCGGPETSFICYPLAGSQRGCFDYSFPDECTTDEDCPAAPNGTLHGECLDSGEGVPSDDAAYHRCFLPYYVNTNRFQCW